MPEEQRPVENTVNETLEEEVQDAEDSLDLTEEQVKKVNEQLDLQRKSEETLSLFEKTFGRPPKTQEELLEFITIFNNHNATLEQIKRFNHSPFDNSLEGLNHFLDRLPKKKIEDLSKKTSATIRWVSDIQDFGAAQHNLKVLEKIIKDSENLDSENSLLLFGGDVFYDQHMEGSKWYDNEELEKLHLDFLDPETRKKIQEIDDIIRKDESLRGALQEQYWNEINKLLSKINPNLTRAHLLGNNEAMPLMQQGMSDEFASSRYSQILHFSEDITKGSQKGHLSNIAGVRVFSAEYWNANRDRVQTKKDTETGEFIKKNGEIVKNTVMYDQLIEDQPNLITVHGKPTYFFEGKRTWEHLEPDGMSKYLDEYSGEDPLYVMCGHIGKQGITRKINSKGKEVILLNSNLDVRKDQDGVSARAITYDLDIKNKKIAGVKAKTYEVKMD